MLLMRAKRVKKVSIYFMVLALLVQPFLGIFPWIETVLAEDTNQRLRIHYEGDSIDNELSLWLWGDVTSPSEKVADWPAGTLFSAEDQTEYGYFVDVELIENAEEIGLIVVNGEGETYTEDIEIGIYEGVEEVWISQEGQLYYYEPITFEEPTLRIHYYTEAEQVEPYGVWFWGDAPNPPSNCQQMPFHLPVIN
jgi:hypothetical protein